MIWFSGLLLGASPPVGFLVGPRHQIEDAVGTWLTTVGSRPVVPSTRSRVVMQRFLRSYCREISMGTFELICFCCFAMNNFNCMLVCGD